MKSTIVNNNLTNLKGYYGVVKAIVMNTEDPLNIGRVQIQIPSYHGNNENLDELPWAQVCVTRVPASNGVNGFINSVQTEGFVDATVGFLTQSSEYQASSADLSVTPVKGDVVWVIFEGGDINYPLVIGVLYATIGNGSDSTSILQGTGEGSPAYLMAQVMMKYESNNNYGAFAEAYANSSNEHAITIGAHQNYATRAKSLLVYLRSLNQSEFDNMARPSGLLDDVLSSSNSWANYKISKSSAKAQAIISILTTSWGINGQIIQASQDVQNYVQQANEDYGVTDLSASFYIGDIIHQYGRGGARKQFSGKTIPNLETAYQIAISYSTTYKNRRTGVFNDIKTLRDSGKFSGNNIQPNGTTATESRSININSHEYIDIINFKEKFIFPLINIRNITKYFSKEVNPLTNRTIIHDGIDICTNNIEGTSVIAVFDGLIKYKTDLDPNNGCGYSIELINKENNNIIAEYRHLSNRVIPDNNEVKEGQIIGTVGNTGSAEFSLLHFSIKINDGYQNPLLYLYN